MAVSNTRNIVTRAGDGVAVSFVYDFPVYNSTWLRVTHITAAGVETPLYLGSDYTADGIGYADGGNINLNSLVPAEGDRIIIQRILPIVQPVAVPDGNPLNEASIERALDEGVMIDQQLDEAMKRSPSFAATSGLTGVVLPVPEVGKALVGNADNSGYVNASVAATGELVLTAFGAGLLLLVDAAAARSLLEIDVQIEQAVHLSRSLGGR